MADVDVFLYPIPAADEVKLRDPATAQPDGNLSRKSIDMLDASWGFIQIGGG